MAISSSLIGSKVLSNFSQYIAKPTIELSNIQVRIISRFSFFLGCNSFCSGAEWVLPLIDNQYGMGKSTFARNYVWQCRTMLAAGQVPSHLTEGIRVIAKCHTVFLVLDRCSLFLRGNERFSDVLVPAMKNELKKMFEVAPGCLSRVWNSASAFLKALVQEAGPIFVVLDEIGSAFFPSEMTGDDDLDINSMLESRRRFFDLCIIELMSWLATPGLFLLLSGRGTFLSFVGRRPDESPRMIASPVAFERLSLHALRAPPIQKILQNTIYSPTNPVSLQQHFRLNDAKMMQVAKRLFDEAYGRPRLLMKAFQDCSSYKTLMSWTRPQDDLRWPQFLRAARRNMEACAVLVHSTLSKEVVDLTIRYNEGGRLIPLDLIATDIGMSWVGSMSQATLFADDLLVQLIMGYGLSFEGYLDSLSRPQIATLSFSSVFEWIFALSFSAMFSEAKAPRLVSPSFFASPVFGSLDHVRLSRARHPLPKIANQGSFEVSLTSKTAHPSAWPTLLGLMERYGPCIWKPEPLSASPDVILISEITVLGCNTILTIGLSIKCYTKTSTMSKAQVEEECRYFARMFSEERGRIGRINILFICATQYRFIGFCCYPNKS